MVSCNIEARDYCGEADVAEGPRGGDRSVHEGSRRTGLSAEIVTRRGGAGEESEISIRSKHSQLVMVVCAFSLEA